jgi:hypothetical protein
VTPMMDNSGFASQSMPSYQPQMNMGPVEGAAVDPVV